MKKTMFRQGDVLIMSVKRVNGLSEVARETGRIVLAHGKATGHAHAIASMDATLFMDEKMLNRYLDVKAQVVLDHEEHTRLELPRGFYEVKRQREYRPEGLRQVAD
jgi:hypothetical protein